MRMSPPSSGGNDSCAGLCPAHITVKLYDSVDDHWGSMVSMKSFFPCIEIIEGHRKTTYKLP